MRNLASEKFPLQFQGSSYVAVVLPDECMTDGQLVFDLARRDGNGGWRQVRVSWEEFKQPSKNGPSFVYVWKSFRSATARGFSKKIGYIVPQLGSFSPSAGCSFVLIEYRWLKTINPWRFPPAKEYTPRKLISRMSDIAMPLASGKSHTPNDVLRQAQAVTLTLTTKNPLYAPASVRQAVYAKGRARKKVLGGDGGVDFLLRHPQVHSETLEQVDKPGQKFMNHIVATDRQLQHFKELGTQSGPCGKSLTASKYSSKRDIIDLLLFKFEFCFGL